jgi:hypothetical protein
MNTIPFSHRARARLYHALFWGTLAGAVAVFFLWSGDWYEGFYVLLGMLLLASVFTFFWLREQRLESGAPPRKAPRGFYMLAMGSQTVFLVLVAVGGFTETRWLIALAAWGLFAKPGMRIAQLVYKAYEFSVRHQTIAWTINALLWALAAVGFFTLLWWPWLAIIGAVGGFFDVGSVLMRQYSRTIRRGAVA